MVEGHALFEWSSEVALALSTRFCSWVVQEDDMESVVTDLNDNGDVPLTTSGPKKLGKKEASASLV